jgi:hypothetical protein
VTTPEPSSTPPDEKLDLRQQGWPAYLGGSVLAVIGLVGGVAMGYAKQDGFQQFFFSYLVAWCFFLFMCLGGLFFVMLQHAVKAGWSVNVRRIAEWFASIIPVMGLLSAPIIIAVVLGAKGQDSLYEWAKPGALDHMSHFKQIYLNPVFFIVRIVFYFVVWSILGLWFWKQSVKQDVTGDYNITRLMQRIAPAGLVIFGVTFTAASFDLLMSLDMDWASTIFGVYCFAGSTLTIIATLILVVIFLQARGFLRKSVTIEHFHDLGKLLFGFTFFYGYIAFDQYMLQWYANLPDETEWYARRGATTAMGKANGWSWVCLLILFAHILIPFAGLMSRHVKRNPVLLGFWAAWILMMEWVDLFWIAMPQLHADFHLDVIDLCLLVGLGGLVTALIVRKASHDAIRPIHDPRLAASLAFENV